MRALELKIPPPLAAGLLGLAMWAAARALPAVDFDVATRLPIAILCPLFGGIVAVSAFWAFRRARTTVSPTKPERTLPSSLEELSVTRETLCTSPYCVRRLKVPGERRREVHAALGSVAYTFR
jgi:hypothetical protein